MNRGVSIAVLALMALQCFPLGSDSAKAEATDKIYSFDDRPTDYDGSHPEWFKQSFLNLDEDLDEALENGKSGLIVYFGQAHCAYCKAIMEKPLSRIDLVEYLIRHFDVVGLSIHDVRELTAPDGETLTVKGYSIREDAQFTPTLIFFDLDGKEVFRVDSVIQFFRLAGVLRYVADKAYQEHPVFQHWKFAMNREEIRKFPGNPVNGEDHPAAVTVRARAVKPE